MHYVIGDVHVCYDELMLLLQKIEAKDKDARYIFVGDFIDRGKQVKLAENSNKKDVYTTG